MRILVTVKTGLSSDANDVLIDAPSETLAGQVVSEIYAVLPDLQPGDQTAAQANLKQQTNNGSINADGRASEAINKSSQPVAWVNNVAVSAKCPLSQSKLTDGSILTLGTPPPLSNGNERTLIELRVVAGTQSGLVFNLPLGYTNIGISPDGAIQVGQNEKLASTKTVRVDLDGRVFISNPTHAAATAQDSSPIRIDEQPWDLGEQLTLEQSVLEVHRVTVPDAVIGFPTQGGWIDYNRPPRILPAESQSVFRLPAKPKAPVANSLPWLGAALPLILGVTMAYIFKQPAYLLLAAFSPVMLVGNFFTAIRQGKKSFRRQLAEYNQHIQTVEMDLSAALESERQGLRRASPDPAELLVITQGPNARLWERRRSDDDHLLLRVGTKQLLSRIRLEDLSQIEHRRSVRKPIDDVPVTMSLKKEGVIGIAGPDSWSRDMGRWLVGQIAALQSPRDVQLYILTEAQQIPAWAWARWLPHLRPTLGQSGFVMLGAGTESLSTRIAELLQLCARRQDIAGKPGSSMRSVEVDVVVVLDGARRLRALPGVVSILKDGPDVGIYSICLDSDERMLPEECRATLVEGDSGTAILRQQRSDDIIGIRHDRVTLSWFDQVARALSPLRDASPQESDDTLPNASRLLEILGLDNPSPDAIAARWLLNGRSSEFAIGVSLDGPLVMDLVRDGPHVLIGGTTGSGKSELLQSMVASLAVSNRPDALTFVLVDYKGGAAFKDCVKLPHTVGLVTDLDPHLVERALTSLSAELSRREHMLAEVGAKDLDDYVDYGTRRSGFKSLPRLIIVIDEFASMARELPEFLSGLVNIAQRGRSLGIHLVLATQRPSGVVSPEIRANTNLRLALRVTDANESSDIIDSSEAATISKMTPGRAYVRLGHASLLPFQAGRVGGRRPELATDADTLPPYVKLMPLNELGRPAPYRLETVAATSVIEETDLSLLVRCIQQANHNLKISKQHSPWLPALPEGMALETSAESFVFGDSHIIPEIPWALQDLPAQQKQTDLTIVMDRFAHMFIVGVPGSGRSQALRTIAASVALKASAADVHLFGIDCGNGALLPLIRLPHCGAVVQRSQTERAVRLIEKLKSELLSRQQVLGDGGFGNLTEQRAASEPGHRLPHLIVLIDRWEGFASTLGEYDAGSLTDSVHMLLREGASVGIHLIVAGDRSLLTGRITVLTDDKFILRLSDKTDYTLAGLNHRQIPDRVPPGRGFSAPGGVEAHVALLGGEATGPSQAASLESLAVRLRERDKAVSRERRPFRVDVLPSNLTVAQAWEFAGCREDGSMWAMIGVGGDELLSVGADLESDAPTFIVAGPSRSGRSTLLTVMADSLLRNNVDLVIVSPRESPLRELSTRLGVRSLFTDENITQADIEPLLTPDGHKVALIVDDGELLREVPCKEWLRLFLRTAAANSRALILGGNAAELAGGFAGWQVDVKKNRRGALLCPQAVTDGDLVGARLVRSMLSPSITPGRAMVHLGSGQLTTVQIPAGNGDAA